MVGIGGPYGGGYALGHTIGGLKIDIEFTVVGVTERYGAVSISTAPLAGSFVVQYIFRCKMHGNDIFFFDDFDRGGSMDEGHGKESINSKKVTVDFGTAAAFENGKLSSSSMFLMRKSAKFF